MADEIDDRLPVGERFTPPSPLPSAPPPSSDRPQRKPDTAAGYSPLAAQALGLGGILLQPKASRHPEGDIQRLAPILVI
jgi:hypothetical protein